jgi:hypothetical protein
VLVGTLYEGTAGAQGGDNGVAAKSPSQIATEARRAAESARSVHVMIANSGSRAAVDVKTADVTADRKNNCVGTVVQPNDEGKFEVIRHGDKVWFKPDAAWLKAHIPGSAGERAAKELAGKFLTGKASDPGLRQVTKLCNLRSIQQHASGVPHVNWNRKGPKSSVNGKKTIEIMGRARDLNLTLHVATQGKAYPVKTTAKGTDVSQTASFKFNVKVPDKTPPASETRPWKG